MGWGRAWGFPWYQYRAVDRISRGGRPRGLALGMDGWLDCSLARRHGLWQVNRGVTYERRGNGHHEGRPDSQRAKLKVKSVIGNGCGHFIASSLGETGAMQHFRPSPKFQMLLFPPLDVRACRPRASVLPSNSELLLLLSSRVGSCIRAAWQPGSLVGWAVGSGSLLVAVVVVVVVVNAV